MKILVGDHHGCCSREVTRGFDRRVLDGVNERSLAGFGWESFAWVRYTGFTDGGLPMTSIPGTLTGDGRFDGGTFLGGLLIFFLGGRGRVTATCLQVITKGGSSILGRPGQTRVMFQVSTVRLIHIRSMLLYVIYLLYVICLLCLVQSPPQEAVVVFGYIEGPFLVNRTDCACEHHATCIEGPFLVSKTGHVRERHAP